MHPPCQVKEEGDQLGCPVLPVCSLHSCLEALKGRQSKLGISLSLHGFQEEMAAIKNLMQSNGGLLIFLSSRGKKPNLSPFQLFPVPSQNPLESSTEQPLLPALHQPKEKPLHFMHVEIHFFGPVKGARLGQREVVRMQKVGSEEIKPYDTSSRLVTDEPSKVQRGICIKYSSWSLGSRFQPR